MKAYGEFRDSTDYLPVPGLQINSCGQQRAGQYGYTILRSKGRSDYHLLYVQSGWITAEEDGAPVCLSSGGFIFFHLAHGSSMRSARKEMRFPTGFISPEAQ